MNPNTYSRIFTNAFAAGLREAKEMDEEEVEMSLIYMIDEIKDIMEKEIASSRDTYSLLHGIQTILETHTSNKQKVIK